MAAAVKKESVDNKSSQPTKPEPVSKKRKVIDFRLASKMEDSRHVRDLLKNNGRVIVWQSPDHVNVMSLDALAMNHQVMCLLADHHCAESKVVKPPAVDFLKAQVGSMSKQGGLLLLRAWLLQRISSASSLNILWNTLEPSRCGGCATCRPCRVTQ